MQAVATEPMKGVIELVKDFMGYAFIRGEDGKCYFAYASEFSGGPDRFRELKQKHSGRMPAVCRELRMEVGRDVEFRPAPPPPKKDNPEAKRIVVLEEVAA